MDRDRRLVERNASVTQLTAQLVCTFGVDMIGAVVQQRTACCDDVVGRQNVMPP